jgi:hypothetical protein
MSTRGLGERSGKEARKEALVRKFHEKGTTSVQLWEGAREPQGGRF